MYCHVFSVTMALSIGLWKLGKMWFIRRCFKGSANPSKERCCLLGSLSTPSIAYRDSWRNASRYSVRVLLSYFSAENSSFFCFISQREHDIIWSFLWSSDRWAVLIHMGKMVRFPPNPKQLLEVVLKHTRLLLNTFCYIKFPFYCSKPVVSFNRICRVG